MATTDLLSLTEVKTLLNISGSSDDSRLSVLITNVSSRILDYLQNNIVIQDRTEYHWGGKKRLYLQRYPLVSGPTISDGSGNSVASADIVTIPEQGIVQHAGCFPTAQDANGNISRWTVVYSAGLAVNTAAVPADLKEACALWVAKRFNRADPSITSKSVGDMSLSYAILNESADGAKGVPPDVAALLSPYMSRGF